jgi:hypothetical protein
MIRGSWQPTAVHTQRSLEEQQLTGLRRLEAIERGPLGKPDIRLRFGHRGASERENAPARRLTAPPI